MKKIEAIIFPVHLDAVRTELRRCGIGGGFTLVEVHYSDSGPSLPSTENGGSRNFQKRVKLEMIVDDAEAEKAVNVILRHTQPQSDEEGGHIAVLELSVPGELSVSVPEKRLS